MDRPTPPLRRSRARSRSALAVAVLAGLLGFAGAASSGAAPSPKTAGFPVTVAGATGAVTFTAAPTRIISLSPTATDMLFSIGAGHQVVAVDDDSSIPADAPRTSLSGLTPNLEAIAKYRPDLVVISYDPNGLAASLKRLGIPVLEEDAASTLRDTYGQIALLGKVTGHAASAQRLVATMRSQIASIVAAAPKFSPALTYYYELDQTYYSVTSKTFIGSLMSLLGLRDIADEASGASSGYPQLSSEYIVKSDPRLIMLADTVCCGQSPKTVAARPGWSEIAAVRHDGVLGLNDTIASLWGPTVVTLERDVERELVKIAAGSSS